MKVVRESYEGFLDEDLGVVISVTGVGDVREGKIIPGDGAAYYDADMQILTYKPLMQEIIEGNISEITEFGAFIKIGPIEGLIHVSQIMDDFINYDPKLPGFSAKDSAKKLVVGDTALARVVTVSLRGNISSSKIGLTMRQFGLGKDEWAVLDEKKKKSRPEKPDAETAKQQKENKAQRKKDAKGEEK
jgi:DNA-directed RNA polymerase subunit E'